MQKEDVAQNAGTGELESPFILICAPGPDQVFPTSEKRGVSRGYSDVEMRIIQLDKSYFDNGPPLMTSELTAKLGFPLQAGSPPTTGRNTRNLGLNGLFACADIDSPQFLSDPADFFGDVALVRADGKVIHPMQIEALCICITAIREKWLSRTKHMAEGEAKQKAKEKVRAKLTPEAFHAFFQDHRLQQVRAGRELWKNVTSPVVATLGEVKPACGACYATAEPGKHLLVCAKCKARYYCARSCQVAEWKEHKKICGME